MIPWSLILGIGKYVGIILAVGLLYLKVTSDAFDRGADSVNRQLIEAREQFGKERSEFNARLNRIAGSIKRRCLAGEQLPECADLER